ncbi:hypothetical protein Tco_0207011 [Tanacetum coccineum]
MSIRGVTSGAHISLSTCEVAAACHQQMKLSPSLQAGACEEGEIQLLIGRSFRTSKDGQEVIVISSSDEDLSFDEEIVLMDDIPFLTLMKNNHKLLQL